jgi:hypothetical protein
MTKKLARLLKADIQETSDLKSIAAMLAGKGRGGDTILAHITPKEVEILKDAGGAGTTNPETGLLEFYEDGGPIIPFESSAVAETQPYTGVPVDYSGYDAFGPSAAGTDIGFKYSGQSSEGFQTPTSGVPSVGIKPTVSSAEFFPMPAAATARPVDVGLSSKGVGTDTLLEGTRPDYSKAGAAEKPFLTNEQYARLGLAGGLGVYGAMQQRKAAEQMKKATGEQTALAKPWQQEGKRLIEAAQRGELTAAGQQQLQGLQAQLAQGAAQRGGVGVAQAAAQAEAFRNQLLQGQYDYGLKVSQIGDQIALGAIRTGMQLDQQLNQANLGFYTQLGSIAAGIPTYRTS